MNNHASPAEFRCLKLVIVTDAFAFGGEGMAEWQVRDASAVMEEWLTDHEGDDLSICVRPARRGEATGTYRKTQNGDLRIVTGDDYVPMDDTDDDDDVRRLMNDRIMDLIDCAWVHACESMPVIDEPTPGPGDCAYCGGDIATITGPCCARGADNLPHVDAGKWAVR